ncbi:MAG: FAD:protein FMN transferase [Treponema sp.]
MKHFFKVAASVFFLSVGFAVLSCSQVTGPHTEMVMGTVCTVNAYSDGTEKLYKELFTRLYTIENDFSVNIGTSEVSAVNAAAGQHAVAVSAGVFYVIRTALNYAALTSGAFDPTVGPLVKIWGINTDHARVPSKQEISTALGLINWHDVLLTQNADGSGTVMLRRPGMALDLGGIVKGYAADELTTILRTRNVKRAVIDLGGNIYVFGKKKDGSLWKVGVKDPSDPEGNPALIISLANSTVVTSGVYERFFIQNGIRYHHILDTKTGYPARTGLLSSTIICESSIAADALSTGVFVLGEEKGMALLQKIERGRISGADLIEVPGLHTRVSAVFIAEDGRVTASKSLEGILKLNKGTPLFK